MSQSKDVSVREAGGIEDIAEAARIEEAKNRLYAQSLPIARAGDSDILDLYFGAIKSAFEDAEKKYNLSVAENRPDAIEKGIILGDALADYTASLDVQYDVVEDAEQESLLPEVNLDEDEQDALAFPIDASRQTEGGQADVDFRLMQLFKNVIEVERELANDEGNLDLATTLARAREEYRWTKEYAIDTGADQVGLTPEEKEAAEKAASGESQEEEVVAEPPSQEQADILQKQIEEQRAKE